MKNNVLRFKRITMEVLTLLMLETGISEVNAAITDGFTQQSVTVSYDWPYNLSLSDRHSGTFPGQEHFWVYTNDAPFMQGSTTDPRTEGVPSPRWTSGVWQFEGDLDVPSGTTGANVMQVFGADPSIGSTAFMLRARFSGELWAYNLQDLMAGIWDEWHHINVIHDDNVHKIQVYIDNTLVYIANDNDNGTHPTHYFKYGVYDTSIGESSYKTEDYWQNTKIWYTPSLPVVPLLNGDFNGDNVPDAVVFNRSTCSWSVRFSSDASVHTFPFGQNGDIAMIGGDFDGDGVPDPVVFRPSDNTWYVRYSKDGSVHSDSFGTPTDTPLMNGDFDHDGVPDAVIYRPGSSSTWYVQYSSDGSVHSFAFGVNGDIPLLGGDFDGDGVPDAVLFRPSNGEWFTRFSNGGSVHTHYFGQSGDIPFVTGDFDGDGQPDTAVFRPSNGTWYVRFSNGGSVHSFQFGQSGDIPMMNTDDFDGDGQPDAVIYRPSNNTWYVRFSSNGSIHSFSY